MTFPTTKEGKAVAFARMKEAAPELMQQIADLRAQFGGQLTYFKAPGVEYGNPSPEGWQVDQALLHRVNPPQLTAEQRERMRKEKLAAGRRRAKK